MGDEPISTDEEFNRKLAELKARPDPIKYYEVQDVDRSALEAETRRIDDDPDTSAKRLGLVLDWYDFTCPGNAHDVLSRAREVMHLISEASLAETWPEDEEWFDRLPAWFVAACLPQDAALEDPDPPDDEVTQEVRRARYFAQKWKLTWWVSWMEPKHRVWMWWRAYVLDPDTVRLGIDLLGDPSRPGDPPGSWWLFAASGATEFDEAEYYART